MRGAMRAGIAAERIRDIVDSLEGSRVGVANGNRGMPCEFCS